MIAPGMYLLCWFEISTELKLKIQLSCFVSPSNRVCDARRFSRNYRLRGLHDP